MPTSEDGVLDRVKAVVEKIGSNRAVEKLASIKEGTVRAWKDGSLPRVTTLKKFAERTGIDPDWLIYGRGDQKRELNKLDQFLSEDTPSMADEHPQSARVAEDPAAYGVDATIRSFTEQTLIASIEEINSDHTIAPAVRIRRAAPFLRELRRRAQNRGKS